MRADEDQIRRTGDQVNGEAGQPARNQFDGEPEGSRRTGAAASLKGGIATAPPSTNHPIHAKSQASG
ncbi:MAG: hypothetical protein CVV64_20620 [Candidatus Wallbacteria bacterium HGW-Wallbacteria-1]|uniref:Uncharacterized protein n=1 Tax=Candidatus Wallbacteria bacterium HGW-Wallbacteria-1 TaxID=2013854 RepID=A0A2N1PI74_9BACT|nr:MAG: hypothetical protein CVV64_20620 [Candidatus Wallbacteria bacterium HGW-Wallbacteria-1]